MNVTDKVWSDGITVNLDDVYYSYHSLLVANMWKLPELDIYSNVVVEQGTGELVVIFPQASVDNVMFFSHFVLPSHYVKDLSFESYRSLYASKPLWSECANLLPRSADNNSLVFDLSKCEDTNLLSYQVKML